MFVKERFVLDEYTVKLLHDMEPQFGYNGFGEFIFYRTYSRFINGKQENWADCVCRVINGVMSIRKDWYLKNYITWDEKWWQAYARKMAISMFKMEFLPPGRGLWAMGTDFVYERGGMALNNCFSGETEFVTDDGIYRLDALVGQTVNVLCIDKKWRPAEVKSFGIQNLQRVYLKPHKIGDKHHFGRTNHQLIYDVTSNHRWILEDGRSTTVLRDGDKIKVSPELSFELDKEHQDYIDGFVHGLIYADGSLSYCTDFYSSYSLRLCGWKDNYFAKCVASSYYEGYTTPPSANGEKTVKFRSKYFDLKTTPIESSSLLHKKGFLDGWIAFDAHDQRTSVKQLDTSSVEGTKWVIKNCVTLGYVITGHNIDNEPTNYGERTYPLNRLTLVKEPVIFRVNGILTTTRDEEVYCVVEPETHTFTLAGGITCGQCGYTEVHDDLADDIGWTMDAMMLGLGIGFTPIRNDKLKLRGNRSGMVDLVIADSREGWVDSVQQLIRAIQYNRPKPRMIYDQVREAGLPIKGFGGISSGPEPLKELHNYIEELMDLYMTDPYYDSVMLKMDLENCVGICVVAGNVRRSAELTSLSIKDPTFKNLKNYEDPKYTYRKSWGWMSNNSVDLEDDEDFDYLGEIAQRVITRGEPGYKNLQNFKYGRIGKKDKVRLDRGRGTNACCCGDTKILLADGRGYVPIKELEGEDVDVFTVDEHDEIVIRKMRHVRKTGYNEKIYKVILDNGAEIRVTGNHGFFLRDWTRKKAKDLKRGDSLKRINRYIPTEENKKESYFDKYISMSYGSFFHKAEHSIIAQNKFKFVFEDEEVHHIDGNRFNNNPDNIELKEKIKHQSYHSAGAGNPKYSGYTHEDLVNFGVQLCLKLNRRFSTTEWQELGPIKNFSEFRKDEFSSISEFAYFCADQAGVYNPRLDTRTIRYYNKMLELGYNAEIVDGKTLIEKKCECCNEMFWIIAQEREQATCSLSCSKKKKDRTQSWIEYRQTMQKKKESLREKQLDIFCALKAKLGYVPNRTRWIQECKNQGVSSIIGTDKSPFHTYIGLQVAADKHNHRVAMVVEDGYEDVYNGTVDDYNNYFIYAGSHNTDYGRINESGILSPNCGEVVLEGEYDYDRVHRVRELCNQAETCPTICNDPKKWLKACEYATLYASTVSLLMTHQPSTNRVVARNRRISVGIIDVSGWKEDIGVNQLTKWLREGYDKVREINRRANSEAGVPEAIRVTTIKPGGTTPKLPGKTPGIGHPTFDYTLRRVNVAKNSPLVPILTAAGVSFEESVTDHYSLIFQWPILQGPAPPAEKISLWEQAMNLVLMQREWADNAVSNTLYFKPKWTLIKEERSIEPIKEFLQDRSPTHDEYIAALAKLDSDVEEFFIGDYKIKNQEETLKIYKYNPDHEEDSIEPVLSAIAPLTKTVSLLPHSPKGVYLQMPEEGISKEEYETRLAVIQQIDWSQLNGSDGQDERYCSGPQCELPIPPQD